MSLSDDLLRKMKFYGLMNLKHLEDGEHGMFVIKDGVMVGITKKAQEFFKLLSPDLDPVCIKCGEVIAFDDNDVEAIPTDREGVADLIHLRCMVVRRKE